ncbi:MAG: 50S ribosomal protein L32e [Candidatus Undinarchaeales archaeon]
MTKKKKSENKKIEVRKELRSKLKKKKPNFRRQNYRHYKAVQGSWRKPRGIHNKLKKYHGGKGKVPSIGYRTPSIVRGLHPSGYEEVLVHDPNKIDKIDPETQAIKIGSSVGGKKREIILKKADKKNIKVLNK